MFWRFAIPTLAAFAALTASPAVRAADMPLPPPAAAEPCCNWYLRGFVGEGMTNKFKLDFLENPAHTTNFVFDQHSNSDTFFIGGGVGYNFNSWLRFDGTVEYRGRTQVNARGTYDALGDGDSYQGYIKSWVFLANAYVDLGTWNCFTPYVGAGVGGAYNQLVDFVDMGIGTTGAGFGRNSANWSPAWALHAGISYDLSKSLKVDLAYRYLNYGSVTDTVDCIGGCIPDSYKFNNLSSHDIMLGLRWTCCDVEQPRQVYMPLHSKG
jgi:opacity protein-like surface antigen